MYRHKKTSHGLTSGNFGGQECRAVSRVLSSMEIACHLGIVVHCCAIAAGHHLVGIWNHQSSSILRLWKKTGLQLFKINHSHHWFFLKKEWTINLCIRNCAKNIHLCMYFLPALHVNISCSSVSSGSWSPHMCMPWQFILMVTLNVASSLKINLCENLQSSISVKRSFCIR